jgi:hypothetical protein
MVPKTRKNLWLIWKDTNTRERFVVGQLSWDGDNYYFEYIEDEGENNLSKSLERGFKLLPAFPERFQEFSSPRLFYTFLNRLPDRNRKDVQMLLERKGLPIDCSDFDFLKATGGRLPTDTLEFVQCFDDEIKDFNIKFYVAGLRHYAVGKDFKNFKDQLLPKDELILKLEPTNPYDSHAIEVLTKSGEKLGYVPVFYSRYLDIGVEKGHCIAKIISFNKEADYNEMLEIEVRGKSNLTEVIESLNK